MTHILLTGKFCRAFRMQEESSRDRLREIMGKIVKAEYDAENQTLHLLEPLKGFKNHEQVTAVIDKADQPNSLRELRGVLSKEAGEDLARVIDEMFPIEK